MGKFDSKNKNSSSDVYQLIAERNAAAAGRPQRPQQSAGRATPQQDTGRTDRQQNTGRDVPQQPSQQQAPVEEPRRRGPRLGGVIFYTFYFLFIFAFFAATYIGLSWLRGWLVDYEAAQPTIKCQQIYDELFADPDWGQLYELAGVEDTVYEGKEEFVAYMEAKQGDQELELMETSAGLSGDKKYILKLGSEKVASFTMNGAPESITDIADWQLGTVEVFFQRTGSYRIAKMDGHTAYVNGVALSDDFTIQIASTIAEDYLPMGLTGVRTCVQEINGLMSLPTVTVIDDKGNAMEVSYDETTRTFTEKTEANTIGDEERTVALKAVETYALFMVKKATDTQVAQYFQRGTETYNTIVRSEVWWTQKNNGAAFSDQEVSGYCRYSDDFFSVRVSMNLDVTRTDGTLKQFPVSTTLFFENQSGKWLVTEMTNVDVQQPRGQVRLTFMNDNEVLTTGFVANDADEVQTPLISAPEGKTFIGWALESVDENGVKTLTIMFGPTENGVVTIPAGTTLEPMTLYAYFENT